MIIIDFKENKIKIRGIINKKIRSQFFSGRFFPELPGRGCSPANASCWRSKDMSLGNKAALFSTRI